MALKNLLNNPLPDDDGEWICINNATWSPERPGDMIEGKLLEKKYNIGKWNHNIYVIRRNDGTRTDVWGCYKLDKKMDEVLEGDIIRIRYKGVIKRSDDEFMYDYDVFKKKTI